MLSGKVDETSATYIFLYVFPQVFATLYLCKNFSLLMSRRIDVAAIFLQHFGDPNKPNYTTATFCQHRFNVDSKNYVSHTWFICKMLPGWQI